MTLVPTHYRLGNQLMPRPSKAVDRRRQIVRGLMRAMAKRGYAGAPVSAIAREAGLTAGLVHYYFESKQDILLAVLRAIHATALERFEWRLSRAGGDPWKRLFALTDALLENDASSEADVAAACWVAIAAEAIHEASVRREYEVLLEDLGRRLQRLLREVLAAEGRSTRNVKALAAAVAALVHGVHHLDAAAPGFGPAGSSAPAARQMIVGAVRAQPAIPQSARRKRTGSRS